MAGQPNPDWTIPDWLPVFIMAKDLGIPPWQVEDECSREWFDNWMAFKEAESEERKRLEKKNKSKRK